MVGKCLSPLSSGSFGVMSRSRRPSKHPDLLFREHAVGAGLRNFLLSRSQGCSSPCDSCQGGCCSRARTAGCRQHVSAGQAQTRQKVSWALPLPIFRLCSVSASPSSPRWFFSLRGTVDLGESTYWVDRLGCRAHCHPHPQEDIRFKAEN